MIGLIKRHEIRALLKAGRSQQEAARFTGVSLRSVKRIACEPDIASVDDAAERRRRRIGRPSVVKRFRGFVTALIEREPGVKSSKILRLACMNGYAGGKSAMYALVASIRKELKPEAPDALRPAAVHPERHDLPLSGPEGSAEDVYFTRDNPV